MLCICTDLLLSYFIIAEEVNLPHQVNHLHPKKLNTMISSSAHTNQPVKKLQVFDSSYFDLIRMYAMYCIYVWIYMSMYNMFFSLYLSTLIAKVEEVVVI